MNHSVFQVIKISLVLSCAVVGISCTSTILIDPELSAPLKVVQDEYKLIYENNNLSVDSVEFVPGNNTMAISDIKTVSIIHIPDNRIIKKLSTDHDASVIYAQASKTNSRFLFSTSDGTSQILDTNNWQVLREFRGKILSSTNGLSPDGKVLYFGDALMSVDTGAELVNFGFNPTSDSHDFSSDGRFFIDAGPYSGTMLVDIRAKKTILRKTIIEHVSQLQFRQDNDFYASYDAIFTLKIAGGGYFPETLSLFSHTTNEIVMGVIPPARIACWTTTPDDKVLMALVNGEVILLNPQLEPLNKWALGDKVNVCQSGQNNQVWLGTKTKGVYKIDLTNKTLSHPVITTQSIIELKISSDDKYLGLLESVLGGSVVKVYQIRNSQ